MIKFSTLGLLKNRRFEASLVILCLTVASIVAAKTYITSSQPMTKPQTSIEYPPLRLTMVLDKTDFAAGEDLTIGFTLKNISNETVTITYSEAIYGEEEGHMFRLCFSFEILDANNTRVHSYTHGWGATQALWSLNLHPMEEISQTMHWNQKPDYDDSSRVPSGPYSIRAIIPPRYPASTFWINNGPRIGLETPSITFTIS